MKEINSINDMDGFNTIVKSKQAVLFYFSNENCNVCKVLKPKVFEMIRDDFPKMEHFYIDTTSFPEIAAQNSVFTIPTILVFFEGNETIRKNRYIGLEELRKEIQRPYQLMF